MSAGRAVALTVILAAGMAAVVLGALRSYTGGRSWWRLLPSLSPIVLVVSAVLVLATGGD